MFDAADIGSVSGALVHLWLALAIGLLVGAERHWRDRGERPGQRTAGIRTFAATGLSGGVAALLAHTLDPAHGVGAAIFIAAAFATMSGAFAWFKWQEAEAEHEFSVTSVIAAQAVFMLGALAMLGQPAVAGAGAIGLTLLLTSREVLHSFVERLNWPELRSAVLLLAMAFVILPLLPDRAVDPWEAINPRKIWMFAVILAGISYVGYIATRLLGQQYGAIVSGLAGGLASSTAVTLTTARQTKAGADEATSAASALAASSVSVTRSLVLVGMLTPGALAQLPAFGAAAAVFALCAALFARRGGASPTLESLGNPFDLGRVFSLTAVLAIAALAARIAADLFGTAGTNFFAALMGAVDVDAVVLSVSKAGAGQEAVVAVMIAVASNTVAKAIYAFALGTPRYAAYVIGGSAAALAAGTGTFLALHAA